MLLAEDSFISLQQEKEHIDRDVQKRRNKVTQQEQEWEHSTEIKGRDKKILPGVDDDTFFANTGKQPHSCPPERTGQSLLKASWKALFHKFIEKLPCCWSPNAGPNNFPKLFGVYMSSRGDCMHGVSVWNTI